MRKYKVGITFGAYELFHIGHLNLIKQAKRLCDKLIVCVSDDEYIKVKKVASDNGFKIYTKRFKGLSEYGVNRIDKVTVLEKN